MPLQGNRTSSNGWVDQAEAIQNLTAQANQAEIEKQRRQAENAYREQWNAAQVSPWAMSQASKPQLPSSAAQSDPSGRHVTTNGMDVNRTAAQAGLDTNRLKENLQKQEAYQNAMKESPEAYQQVKEQYPTKPVDLGPVIPMRSAAEEELAAAQAFQESKAPNLTVKEQREVDRRAKAENLEQQRPALKAAADNLTQLGKEIEEAGRQILDAEAKYNRDPSSENLQAYMAQVTQQQRRVDLYNQMYGTYETSRSQYDTEKSAYDKEYDDAVRYAGMDYDALNQYIKNIQNTRPKDETDREKMSLEIQRAKAYQLTLATTKQLEAEYARVEALRDAERERFDWSKVDTHDAIRAGELAELDEASSKARLKTLNEELRRLQAALDTAEDNDDRIAYLQYAAGNKGANIPQVREGKTAKALQEIEKTLGAGALNSLLNEGANPTALITDEKILDASIARLLPYMDEAEKNAFRTFVSSSDWAHAGDFLDTLRPKLEAMAAKADTEAITKYGEKSFGNAAASTFMAGTLGALGAQTAYFDNLYTALNNKLVDAFSLGKYRTSDVNSGAYAAARAAQDFSGAAQAYNAKVGEQTGMKELEQALNLISGASSSALSNVVQMAMFGKYMLPVMATQAAGMTTTEMLRSGASAEDTAFMSTMSGIVEYMTEKVPLEHMLDRIGQIADLKKGGLIDLPDVMRMIRDQGMEEASEEVIGNIAENLIDIAYNGSNSEFGKFESELRMMGYSNAEARTQAFNKFFVGDSIEAAVSAFISSAMLLGPTAVMQNSQMRKIGNQVLDHGSAIEEAAKALELPDSEDYAQGRKAGLRVQEALDAGKRIDPRILGYAAERNSAYAAELIQQGMDLQYSEAQAMAYVLADRLQNNDPITQKELQTLSAQIEKDSVDHYTSEQLATADRNIETQMSYYATQFMRDAGLSMKDAQERCIVLNDLLRGKTDIPYKDFQKLDMDSAVTRRIFTELTGIEIPEGVHKPKDLMQFYKLAPEGAAAKARQEAVANDRAILEQASVQQQKTENLRKAADIALQQAAQERADATAAQQRAIEESKARNLLDRVFGRPKTKEETKNVKPSVPDRSSGRDVSQSDNGSNQQAHREESELARDGKVRATGERVSAAGANLEGGSTIAIARKYTKSDYTDKMKSVEKKNAKLGVKTVFLDNNLVLRAKNGEYIYANGVWDPKTKTIYINANHSRWSVEEINGHEMFHAMKDDIGLSMEDARDQFVEDYDQETYDKIVDRYEKRLGEGLTKLEYFEEFLADANGGLQRIGSIDVQAYHDFAAGLVSGETKNTGHDMSGVKTSIETLPDGKQFVKADRQVIFGNNEESWRTQLEDYINGKIRKGEDVQLIGADGDVLTLTADTAGKVSSHLMGQNWVNGEAYERKLNAGAHIDELAKISKRNSRIKPDEGDIHGEMARKGWIYRKAFFLDFNNKYYEVRISTALGPNGTTVYNVGKMKERTFPTVSGSSAQGGAQDRKSSSSDATVAQKKPVVKNEIKTSVDTDNEQRLDDLEAQRQELIDQLDFAEGSEEKELNNRLAKVNYEIDRINAEERRAAVSTPIGNILKNLDDYRRIDLISIGNQYSDGNWDGIESMTKQELVSELRDVLQNQADEDPSIRYYVRPVTSQNDNITRVRFSQETDPEVLDKLENEPTVTVYRAMQEIDGKLYPPMAARVDDGSGKRKLVEPTTLGTWYRADEHPELVDKNGKFKLDKANGSTIDAAYNPYWHTSRSLLNDQFSSAHKRPNLVTVECEVPVSELTSGYRAEGAKDAVGEMYWHSGPVSSKLAKQGNPRRVILSRWVKVNRVVSDAEAARNIAQMLAGTDIDIPANTVTPSLRSALEAEGVRVTESGRVRFSTDTDMTNLMGADMMEEGLTSTDAKGWPVGYEGDQPLRYEEKFSVDTTVDALNLRIEKVGDAFLLYDEDGNRVEEVTPEMVENSPLGWMLRQGAKGEDRDKQYAFFAQLIDSFQHTQDLDMIYAITSLGFQPFDPVQARDYNRKKAVFGAYTSNSDPQYSTTVDFTTICLKTQQIVDVMSKTMMDLGRGLTEDEIVNIVYKATHKAGEPVPCPVCYVFSRWVGLGGLFSQIDHLQEKYRGMSREQVQARRDELLRRSMEILQQRKMANPDDAKAQKAKNPTAKDRAKVAEMIDARIDELYEQANVLRDKQLKHRISEKLPGLTEAEQSELDDLEADLEALDEWAWVNNVVLNPKYDPVPPNILYNINAGAEFAEKHSVVWKYRTTRGPAMGKATTPYAPAVLGQFVTGRSVATLNSKNENLRLAVEKNPFRKPEGNSDATKKLTAARKNAKAQNLIGGQRYQSTSDFRFEYALDYLLSFVDLQAIGSKVQLYTKVPEAVPFLASVGADVNCSLMPLGKGWGTDANGNKFLRFSSVTGMNEQEAFAFSAKYDNVQPIMVGLNRTHIELCLADDRITFVIPYHASGASEGRYYALMEAVGEKINKDGRTDYSNYQNDKRVANPTAAQNAAYNARLKILTGEGSKLTDAEKDAVRGSERLSNLYMRFYGETVDGEEAKILEKYLAPSDRADTTKDNNCFGVTFRKNTAEMIFPYEYWDMTTTFDRADENGQAFLDYCEELGVRPRFSGWSSQTGAYNEEYDFSKLPGYWKTLIDRKMYNNDGSYHEQRSINVTDMDMTYVNRAESIAKLQDPANASKPNNPAKTDEIVEKVKEEIAKRSPKTSVDTDLMDIMREQGADMKVWSEEAYQRAYDTLMNMTFAPNPTELPKAKESVGAAKSAFEHRTEISKFRLNTLNAVTTQAEQQNEGLREEDMTYDVVTEKESVAGARARLEQDFDGEVNDLMKRSDWSGEDVDTAMLALGVMLDEGAKSGDYNKAVQLAQRIRERATQGGQFVQAFAKYSRHTGAGLLVRNLRTMEQIWQEQGVEESKKKHGVPNDIPGRLTQAKKNELIRAMTETATTLDAMEQGDTDTLIDIIVRQAKLRNTRVSDRVLKDLRKTASEPDGFQYLRNFAETQFLQIPLDYKRASLGKRLSTYQTISHLFNLRTAGRNVVSNTVFDVAEAAANNLAVGIDAVVGNVTGQRTIGWDASWFSKAKRAGAAQGARRSAIEASLDVKPSETKDKYGTANRTNKMVGNAFERFLSSLEKAMGYELNVTDEFAKGGISEETLRGLQQFVDAGKLTTEEAAEIAKQEMLYRTFQDETMASNVLKGLKQTLNKVGFPGGEFGLGDLVCKYTQVPGALLTRQLEFSPFGYLKTISLLAHMAKTKGQLTAMEQRNLALSITRATTGTGLIMLFAALAKAGIMTRPDDRDDADARALLAASGITGTQFNLSAALRALKGESYERQDGDTLMDIAFLEPLSGLMTIGTLLNGSKADAAVGKWADSMILGTWQAFSDLSVMSTIKTLKDAITYADGETGYEKTASIALEFAMSNVSGFIPAPIRQTAQAFDPFYRDSYGSTDAATNMKYQVMSAIPGLREKVPEKMTAFGDTKEYGGSAAQRFLNAFINPGNVRTYRSDPTAEKVLDVYQKTGDETIIPDRNAARSVTFDKQKYVLTDEQRREYLMTAGATEREWLDQLFQSDEFNSLDPTEQAALIKSVNSKAKDFAKTTVLNSAGVDSMKLISPEVQREIDRLGVAGETGLSPSIPTDSTISVPGRSGYEYQLTDAQMTAYQKLYRDTYEQSVSDLISSDAYKAAGDEEKAGMIRMVRDYVKEAAKAQTLADDSLTPVLKADDNLYGVRDAVLNGGSLDSVKQDLLATATRDRDMMRALTPNASGIETDEELKAKIDSQVKSAASSTIKSAYVNGEMTEKQAVEALMKYGVSEKQTEAKQTLIEAQLGKSIGTAAKDGDINEKEYTKYYLDTHEGKTENDAFWAYQSATSGEGYKMYNRLADAVRNQTNLTETIRFYTEHGKDEEDLRSAITSAFKPEFVAATDKEREAMMSWLVTAYTALGLTEYKARKNILKWLDD